MIEKLSGSKETENPNFKYIKSRRNSVNPDIQDHVTQVMLDLQHRREVFLTLVREMRSEWRPYRHSGDKTASQNVVARDAEALGRVSERISESAQLSSSAMRPDEGLPSALEWFLLNILSEKEWENVCLKFDQKGLKKQGETAFSLESVVQNVLNDEPRTKAFVLDVHDRVKDLVDSGHAPRTIYEIGCGPFPILAIEAAISSPESKIVCVEKNPLSAASGS